MSNTDGLQVRILAAGGLVTKSVSAARKDVENGIAEFVGEAKSDGLRIRLSSGDVVVKSRHAALKEIASGKATLAD